MAKQTTAAAQYVMGLIERKEFEVVQVIFDKLTDLLQDTFDDEDIVARPELSASEVDGWDSLAHVRFLLAVERAFGVRFSAAEANSFANVGDLANAIAAKNRA